MSGSRSLVDPQVRARAVGIPPAWRTRREMPAELTEAKGSGKRWEALLGVLPSASLLRANSNPQLQQAQIVSPPPPYPRRLPPRLPATPPLLLSCGPRIGEADTLPVAQRLWGPAPHGSCPGTSAFSITLLEGPILQARSSAHRSATVLPWQRPGLTACA
ncbi:unnamed protein product [Rangifer tarandus platyrhynchus]|uniref:Uncharacterized protein n=1 Tax=Rangifer tarandus platyrhynchus TaxID=3082113 RepID=A0AC59ZBF4_RANTA